MLINEYIHIHYALTEIYNYIFLFILSLIGELRAKLVLTKYTYTDSKY